MIFERQLIVCCLLLAAILFVLGFLAMTSAMLAACVCWGVAIALAMAAITLYLRVMLHETLTPRRRRD